MPSINDIKAGDSLGERAYTATNVSLFLYNAAIWNPHRIHYDEPYTIDVEKHPGVVIDGPLQGDWLTQVVIDWLDGDGELVDFQYSNRKAAYLGQTLTTGGTVKRVDPNSGEIELELFVRDGTGEVISPGTATVRL